MKTAPHLALGLTTCAALVAGYVLVTQDRALFEPGQAQPLVWGVSPQGAMPAQDVGFSLRRARSKEAAGHAPPAASPATRAARP